MRALTVALFFLSFSALAQNNSIHVYPWNPDSDNDNQIGVDDLQSFLTVYGNSFGLPPEPCTYDGTDFEDLMFGIADGSIILDSLFVEYELEDISTYFPLGCPDQVTDTIIFSHSYLMGEFNNYANYWQIYGYDSYGAYASFAFAFTLQEGTYNFQLNASVLDFLGFNNDGFFGSQNSDTPWISIPFPTDWYLDEDGIHIESGWNEGTWVSYANYLHILPYWHYADE